MQNNSENNRSFEDDELTEDELDGTSGGISKSNLDSLGEMGEMESMKLQTFMDRKSKSQEAMSNLNQKAGQTSDTITQHLK